METQKVLELAEKENVKFVSLQLTDLLGITKEVIVPAEKLKDIFSRHPGSCRGYVHLLDPEKTDTVIALSDATQLKAGSALTREVKRLLGYNASETICEPTEISSKTDGYNGKRRTRR